MVCLNVFRASDWDLELSAPTSRFQQSIPVRLKTSIHTPSTSRLIRNREPPYHRYSLLLLPQPARPDAPYSLVTEARSITSRSRAGRVTSRYLPIPVVPQSARTGFNVREFCKSGV